MGPSLPFRVEGRVRAHALNLLKSAPADGSVLAMTPYSPISLYPHIFKNLQYKPFEDFTPVGTASMIHHGFAVGPMVPASVKNVKDFIVWAKANGWNAPKPPTRMPVFADDPGRRGKYPR